MIQNLINKHISKAFDLQLSDAVSSFDVLRKSKKDGWTDEFENDITGKGRGVISKYKDHEIDDLNIKRDHLKLVYLVSECDMTVEVGDYVNKYKVVNKKQDPTNTVATLQLAINA